MSTRAWSLVLGLGLVILGLTGLSQATGGIWMAWLDIILGIISFAAAGSAAAPRVIPSETTAMTGARPSRSGGLFFLSLCLFVMWIVGLASGSVSTSLVWWNFAFACAYGLVGIASYGRRGALRRPAVTGEERPEQPRRAA
jgi:hypothetical protein